MYIDAPKHTKRQTYDDEPGILEDIEVNAAEECTGASIPTWKGWVSNFSITHVTVSIDTLISNWPRSHKKPFERSNNENRHGDYSKSHVHPHEVAKVI